MTESTVLPAIVSTVRAQVPEPVMDAAKLGGLVSAAVTAVVGAAGVIATGVTADNASAVGLAVGGAVTALLALGVYVVTYLAGRQARAQVTPLESPVSADGIPLVTDLPGRHSEDYDRG